MPETFLWLGTGNQCFFNALLQVYFHTRVLPKILWKSYPHVPDLPSWLNEEELMHYQPPVKPNTGPKTPERVAITPSLQSEASPERFVPLEIFLL